MRATLVRAKRIGLRAAVLGAAMLLAGCAAHETKMVGTTPALKETLAQPESWFHTPEGRKQADIVVSWQNANGGWWKKYDPAHDRPGTLPPPSLHDAAPGDTEDVWRKTSTIDNNATYSEIRILARAWRATGDKKYSAAAERGIEYLRKAQYPNGGWPQRYPLQDNYGRFITFNDDAMLGAMLVMRDVRDGKPEFAFVPAGVRQRCAEAFDRGIDCILKCQYRREGHLTVWGQQHDPETFLPREARAYELPSLTADESADLVLLLMQIDKPDWRVRDAVESAYRWFEANKITGERVVKGPGKRFDPGYDVHVVDDPNAEPMWARFYDLVTGKPFFVGRDGVKHQVLSEVPLERRVGYTWFGDWGKAVEAAYPEWKKRVSGLEAAMGAGPTRTVVVAADGSGQYRSIQAAIDAIPVKDEGPVVVQIRPGTYHERVELARPHVKLVGDDPKSTVISYGLYARVKGADGQEIGTFRTWTVGLEGDDDAAETLTIENTAGEVGQALALSATGDREVVRNCRLLGWQDTLYADGGRQYYDRCYIEGRTDFIFGSATAVFDHCQIHSKNGGYVTAADTPAGQKFGYVFLDCTLTGEGQPAWLGRPWRWERGSRASVTFIRCKMDENIRPAGWNPWNHGPTTMNTNPAQTTRYAEFGTMDLDGRPLDLSARVTWARQLTATEAQQFTPETVLAGPDAWNPARGK